MELFLYYGYNNLISALVNGSNLVFLIYWMFLRGCEKQGFCHPSFILTAVSPKRSFSICHNDLSGRYNLMCGGFSSSIFVPEIYCIILNKCNNAGKN